MRVFGFFLHEQKETRPQAKLRTHCRDETRHPKGLPELSGEKSNPKNL